MGPLKPVHLVLRVLRHKLHFLKDRAQNEDLFYFASLCVKRNVMPFLIHLCSGGWNTEHIRYSIGSLCLVFQWSLTFQWHSFFNKMAAISPNTISNG